MHNIAFDFGYLTLLETNYTLGGYYKHWLLTIIACGNNGGLCLHNSYLCYDKTCIKLSLPVRLESIYNLNVVDWGAYAPSRN